ncbi:hypothetical protein [Halalkalicoccus salilacus]|uniref:hypothetical protein n=1 Tax=Halalkalicoccus salilacus TaxID=3117459 RepID=UPI00300F79A6
MYSPTLGTRRHSELESRPDASSSLREVLDNKEGGRKVQSVEKYGRTSIIRKISISNTREIFDGGGEANSVGDAFRQADSAESIEEALRNDQATPIEVVDPRNGTKKKTTKSVEVHPDGIPCRVINVDELTADQKRIIREGMD